MPIPIRCVLLSCTSSLFLLFQPVFLGSTAALAAEPAAGESAQTITVTETHDGRPFDYCIQSKIKKSGYTLYRLTYPSPVVTQVVQNNTIPAEYYLPDGVDSDGPQRPAVICMHILNGNFALVRMTCTMLASHGIPALMFKLPYYGERGLPQGPEAMAADPKLMIDSIGQAVHDVRRTVDLLASRPEVNPRQIGITGISLGGVVSATAAGMEPRINRAMLILAGGDLMTTIHEAEETDELSRMIRQLPPEDRAQIRRAIHDVDPLTHAANLRDRAKRGRVLMVNATDDKVVPGECTRKLARALGINDQVIWLEGLGHYTAMAALPRILTTTVDFFAQDMRPELRSQKPVEANGTATEMIVALLRQLAALFGAEPAEGRCHFVEMSISVDIKDGKNVNSQLLLARGSGHKFTIDCDLPMIGSATLGQSDYPWIKTSQDLLIKGSDDSTTQPADPLTFALPEHRVKLQVVAGAITGLALAPDLIEQAVGVRLGPPQNGRAVLLVSPKDRSEAMMRIVLRPDGRSPESITVGFTDAVATVTFRTFELNTVAHPALFDPPSGTSVREVDRDTVYRIFSSIFNFAMEFTE
jgi:cephalosporin-C deacetylase-like acetyl esterase